MTIVLWPGGAADICHDVTENTSQVRAVCQITGAWSGVSMTCMADPAIGGGNDPDNEHQTDLNLLRWRGRHPLAWEAGSEHEYRHHHQYSQRYHSIDPSRHHPHCLCQEEQDLTWKWKVKCCSGCTNLRHIFLAEKYLLHPQINCFITKSVALMEKVAKMIVIWFMTNGTSVQRRIIPCYKSSRLTTRSAILSLTIFTAPLRGQAVRKLTIMTAEMASIMMTRTLCMLL